MADPNKEKVNKAVTYWSQDYLRENQGPFRMFVDLVVNLIFAIGWVVEKVCVFVGVRMARKPPKKG